MRSISFLFNERSGFHIVENAFTTFLTSIKRFFLFQNFIYAFLRYALSLFTMFFACTSSDGTSLESCFWSTEEQSLKSHVRVEPFL